MPHPAVPSSKAFPMGRGDRKHDNLWILRCLLKQARSCGIGVKLAFLDVRKAFDSVSHESLLLAAERIGLPSPLLGYLRLYYARLRTRLKVGGRRSAYFSVKQGVRQGDPLSPLLFNSVIDWVLEDLPAELGASLGDERVPYLGFADDLVLTAESSIGLVTSLEYVIAKLRLCGLELNPSKCRVLTIRRDVKAKKWAVDSTAPVRLSDGVTISRLSRLDEYKYLGLSLLASGVRGRLKPLLSEGLSQITRAPLKPQQRMRILRFHLLPQLHHGAVLGSCSIKGLKWLDSQARIAVRRWLRLPGDASKALIHSPCKHGGLGIPSLALDVPLFKRERLAKMRVAQDALSDAVVAKVVDSPWFEEVESKWAHADRTLGGVAITNQATRNEALSGELSRSVDGRGFRILAGGKGETHGDWVTHCGVRMPGWAFIGALHLRSGLLYTGVRRARWGPAVGCRRCAGSGHGFIKESLGHILQTCTFSHTAIVHRHNSVVSLLAKQLRRKHLNVFLEPTIGTSGAGNFRPDLIVRDVTKDEVVVVDVAIASDGVDVERDVLTFHVDKRYREKCKKYSQRAFVDAVARIYKVARVRVAACVLNWRGVWCPRSIVDVKLNFNLPKVCFDVISRCVCEKGFAIYKHHQRSGHRSGSLG